MRDAIEYEDSARFAHSLDKNDSLSSYREKFYIPTDSQGQEVIYFCGNSLGLQTKNTAAEINTVLHSWAEQGVGGHFKGSPSWIDYNKSLKENVAKIVGASAEEVVVMNTLSVNLHLLLASFYNPSEKRNKVLIESDAFPSDKYVVASHLKWHGFNPSDKVIEVNPTEGKTLITIADIERILDRYGKEIEVVLLGGINYYTGQLLDIKKITSICHSHGCKVGFDLAHAAGNVPLQLHNWNVDFATWCNYKYLNSGPGAIAAAYIHKKHHQASIPRLEGWWGNNITTRFDMVDTFDPSPDAEAWVMSTPPTLAIAAIKSALEIHTAVGMSSLREKSVKLTGYLEYLIHNIENNNIEIITPSDPDQRGCQLSIRVKGADKRLFDCIQKQHVEIDWRAPDVIRVAPVPLYNTFMEVYSFVKILKSSLKLLSA